MHPSAGPPCPGMKMVSQVLLLSPPLRVTRQGSGGASCETFMDFSASGTSEVVNPAWEFGLGLCSHSRDPGPGQHVPSISLSVLHF